MPPPPPPRESSVTARARRRPLRSRPARPRPAAERARGRGGSGGACGVELVAARPRGGGTPEGWRSSSCSRSRKSSAATGSLTCSGLAQLSGATTSQDMCENLHWLGEMWQICLRCSVRARAVTAMRAPRQSCPQCHLIISRGPSHRQNIVIVTVRVHPQSVFRRQEQITCTARLPSLIASVAACAA